MILYPLCYGQPLLRLLLTFSRKLSPSTFVLFLLPMTFSRRVPLLVQMDFLVRKNLHRRVTNCVSVEEYLGR